MRPESPKHLEDMRVAASYILRVTSGRSLVEYREDSLLRPAVERHFEIIGEALNRLFKCDPDVARAIPDHAQIIAFRNILIHAYDVIDDRRVWDAIQNSLPVLHRKVVDLLAQ